MPDLVAAPARALPHNLEAERSVLGAILIHNEAFNYAAQTLRPDDFFRDAHRRIFDKMSALSERGEAIDIVTLKEVLSMQMARLAERIEEQRRLHAEVSIAQGQLAASERRAGTIAERERVSREIHDTVTQGLASSLLLLEAAGRAWPADGARTDLRQATTLLRGNLSETRSLVHELASPGLDASPLPEALLLAARQYVPGAHLLSTGEPRPVSTDVRHALLRVVQSAAANIKLHASATTATVTLGFLPDAVTLDIYDDGSGFDPAAAAPPSDAGGYGLRAMRQRVEQLGGVFSVESTPGEGTIVAAQLPAPADGPAAPPADRQDRA